MADADSLTDVTDAADAAVAARVGVTAGDWRDAVRAACRPLVEQGALEPRYADRCIAIVEDQGPYIVVTPGVALAHARPADGVVRLALCAVSLATPVSFGHPTNDPVDVVFAFGSPDTDAHIGLLAALSRALVAGLADALRSVPSDAAATALVAEVARDDR